MAEGTFAQALGKDVATNAANTASTGLFGGIMDLFKMRKQQKYAMQNMEKSNELAMQQQEHSSQLQMSNWTQMFDKQLNSIAAQKQLEVQGLRNAGMNPSLASGQTTVGAAPSPSSSAPTGSVGAPSGPMANMVSLSNQSQLANIRLMESQADLNEAKAYESENAGHDSAMLRVLRMDNMELANKLQSTLDDVYKADVQNKDASTRYFHELAQQVGNLTPEMLKKLNNENALLSQEYKFNLDAMPLQLQQYFASLALLQEQAETERHKQSNLDSGSHLNSGLLRQAIASSAELMSMVGLNEARTDTEREQKVRTFMDAIKLSAEGKNAQEINRVLDKGNLREVTMWLNAFSPILGGASVGSLGSLIKVLAK